MDMKTLNVVLAVSLGIAMLDARASSLSLDSSNVLSQASYPGYNDIIQGPVAATASAPAGPNTAEGDLRSGVQQFVTSNKITEGTEEPTLTAYSTTVGGGFTLQFRYSGASPLVLPAGAIKWRVSASFTRLIFGGRPDLGAAAITNLNSNFTLSGSAVGTAQAVARVDITERYIPGEADNEIDIRPTRSDTGDLIQLYDVRPNGVDFRFHSPEIVMTSGATLRIATSLYGNAGQSVPCLTSECPTVDTFIDAANGGQLTLVLPQGTTVDGLPEGVEFDWISTAQAVPMPRAATALLAVALLLLGTMTQGARRGRRHT